MPSDAAGVPPPTGPPSFDGSFAEPVPGVTRIGRYRIVRRLGAGGMGVVYLAEQDEPVHRQVALKVIRAGTDTDEIVARFASERQTLALMAHPNITSVYDAGVTESGLPFFVMEYVVGEPLSEYADTHRLSVRERVHLFTQVCHAIQHAHQKGIIHRDIKPSNVLVTGTDDDPVCKVIDFGIAKAVVPTADSARLTATGISLGTPAYMSPEQFMSDGTDVDTRADIYALGAMLYELLSGLLPYNPGKSSGWAALIASHVGSDAPAPSVQYGSLPAEQRTAIARERSTDPATLRTTLAGDLDFVILTAIDRDRDRRYATTNALVQDVAACLANQPLAARPASLSCRSRKFVRRHRIGVTFAATIVVLLIAAAVGATIQARRIARARGIAEARQGQAEDLIGFMLGDLADSLGKVGKLSMLDGVGRAALTYFAAVPAEQLSDEELFRRAQALQQLGEVRMAQEQLPAAAALMQQSIDVATRLAAHDSLNAGWQLGLAHSEFWAGNVDWQLGEVDSALAHFQPFVEISRRLIARFPDSLSYRQELAYALNNIGFAREGKGDISAALASYRAALEIEQALVDRDSTHTDWQVSLAADHNAAAVAQRKLGDLAGALTDHRRELAIREALAAREPADPLWQRYLGIAHAYLGELDVMMGDMSGAIGNAREARTIYAALVARDPGNASWQWSLAKSERQLGQALLEHGEAAAALQQLNAGHDLAVRLLAKSPGSPRVANEVVLGATARARALLALGRLPDAETSARMAVAGADSALAESPTDIDRRVAAGDSRVALGEVLGRSGKSREAGVVRLQALALVDSIAGAGQQTEVLAVQAAALLDLDRMGEARSVVAELQRRGYLRPTFVSLVRSHTRPAAP